MLHGRWVGEIGWWEVMGGAYRGGGDFGDGDDDDDGYRYVNGHFNVNGESEGKQH